MPSQTVDLQVDQGADFSEDFDVQDPVTGGPQPFAGASARMMLRASPSDALPLVSISSTPNASGSIALNEGTFTITLTKAATATITVVRCFYELMIDWADGTTTALMGGTVFVNPAITH